MTNLRRGFKRIFEPKEKYVPSQRWAELSSHLQKSSPLGASLKNCPPGGEHSP
jgi:hypothetical protein